MKIIDTQGRIAREWPENYNVNMVSSGRVFLSPLPHVATAITLVSGTAYWVYVGQTTRELTVNYVELYVSTAGAGSETAEVGVFTTPNAPNRTNQGTDGIVKLHSVALTGLTTGGVKRNITGFNVNVQAGKHLWAGIRTAMGTTQPTVGGLCMDYNDGLVLSTASAGALTNAGPWTGAIISVGNYMNSAVAPDLRVTMD